VESRGQLEEAGRGCRKGKKVQLEQEEAAADRKGKVARLHALKALKSLKALAVDRPPVRDEEQGVTERWFRTPQGEQTR
jgi:hypothetical protein